MMQEENIHSLMQAIQQNNFDEVKRLCSLNTIDIDACIQAFHPDFDFGADQNLWLTPIASALLNAHWDIFLYLLEEKHALIEQEEKYLLTRKIPFPIINSAPLD